MKEVHIFCEGALVFDKLNLNSLDDKNALIFFSILLEKYFISLHILACSAGLSIFIIEAYIKEKIQLTKLYSIEIYFPVSTLPFIS